MYLPLLGICILCLFFIIVEIITHYQQLNKNKCSHLLFIYCIICVLANLIAFILQYLYINNKNIDGANNYLWLFGFSLLFNLISVHFFNKKSKSEYTTDFLMPAWVKKYLDIRTVNESEKRAFVAFILYPFWILSPIPFGIMVFLYVIPLSLFVIIGMEGRCLFHWLHEKDEQGADNNDGMSIFNDYYLILDLPTNASSLEIEKSFNHKMAKYNSTSEKLKNKEEWLDLQEAYRVLVSENRLRPLYDKEYLIYEKSELISPYIFTDKKLERDINLIRDTLRRDKSDQKQHKRLNIVVLSLILWILLSIATGFYYKHNQENYQKNVSHKKSMYETPSYDYSLPADEDEYNFDETDSDY